MWRVFNATHQSDLTGDRVVLDAHMWLPVKDGEPRLLCLRTEILNSPNLACCFAIISVLNPEFGWTELRSAHPDEWRHKVPKPTGRFNDSRKPLDHFAAGMFSGVYDLLSGDRP